MLERLTVGDFLYREGDTNDCAYVIAEGNVILFRDEDGTRRIIERRGSGSIVGEVSVLRGLPRAVSVQAETNCIVFRISAEQIAARFADLDPLMTACIETTIGFIESMNSSDKASAIEPKQPTNLEVLIDRLQLEADLEEGLKRNEFHMNYQPIYDLARERIAGFEALMRWMHPALGFVRPDHFIAVAEEMGSISKLTNFAVSNACAALADFRRKSGSDGLFMSINMTARDLMREDFIGFLCNQIDLNALEPCDVKLEITESALVSSTSIVEFNLNQLSRLGFGISVDDFGTGYSNLGHLHLLPLTALKVDRVFANGAHKSKINLSIVRMLISLAKELGVDVIAEGLENRNDVDALKNLGCRYFQGYHFYKPMPFEETLANLLAAENPAAE
ncbi:MAG: EAL domain-containing protein [Pseudomonadota bacterium]